MSIFCGDRCKCKRRGKGYFSGMPELERGFGKACDAKPSLTREEYLCSGKFIDEAQVMLMYGFDPCSGGKNWDQVLDPGNTREENNQDFQSSKPIFIGLGVLIVVGLLILWLVNKK
jgi:hypothetical protein